MLNAGSLKMPLKSLEDQANLSLLFTKSRRREGKTQDIFEALASGIRVQIG